MMESVRSKSSFPILSDFTNAFGSPIVIDRAAGNAYLLSDGDVITGIGRSLFLDVKRDFGAKGDNSTDDTLAIQAAFTAASSQTLTPTHDVARYTVPRVFFPKGIYKVTASLTLPDVVIIDGDNAIINGGNTVASCFVSSATPYMQDIRNIQAVNFTATLFSISKGNNNYQTLDLYNVVGSNCLTGLSQTHPSGNCFVRIDKCNFNGCSTFLDLACDIAEISDTYFSAPVDAGAAAGSGTIVLTGNQGGSLNGEFTFTSCHFGPPGSSAGISERAWVKATSAEDVVFVRCNFGGEVGRRTALNAVSCGSATFIGCSANSSGDTVGYSGGTIGYCRMFSDGVREFTVIGGRKSVFYDYAIDWSSGATPDNTKIYHINNLATGSVDRSSFGGASPYTVANYTIPSALRFKTFPLYVNNEQVHTKKIILRDGGANDATSTLDLVFQHGSATDFDQSFDDVGPMIRATKTGVYGGAAATKSAQLELHTTFNGVTSARVAIKDVGGLCPPTDAGVLQTASAIYAGTGVPNNANGGNGDYYLRSDGIAGSRFYHKEAGAWVASAA